MWCGINDNTDAIWDSKRTLHKDTYSSYVCGSWNISEIDVSSQFFATNLKVVEGDMLTADDCYLWNKIYTWLLFVEQLSHTSFQSASFWFPHPICRRLVWWPQGLTSLKSQYTKLKFFSCYFNSNCAISNLSQAETFV